MWVAVPAVETVGVMETLLITEMPVVWLRATVALTCKEVGRARAGALRRRSAALPCAAVDAGSGTACTTRGVAVAAVKAASRQMPTRAGCVTICQDTRSTLLCARMQRHDAAPLEGFTGQFHLHILRLLYQARAVCLGAIVDKLRMKDKHLSEEGSGGTVFVFSQHSMRMPTVIFQFSRQRATYRTPPRTSRGGP